MYLDELSPEQLEKFKIDTMVALDEWSSRYETRDGTIFIGERVAEVMSRLSRKWRGSTKLDGNDLRKIGFKVVEARYRSGAHPKAFAREVLAKDWS